MGRHNNNRKSDYLYPIALLLLFLATHSIAYWIG